MPLGEALISALPGPVIEFFGRVFGGMKKHREGHDRELLERFNATLPHNQRVFLREHDFGGSYDRRKLDGVIEIAGDWGAAEFEFMSKKLQRSFAKFRAAASKLVDLTLHYTYVHDGNLNLMGPLTDMDRANGESSQQTLERIAEMNAAARHVSTTLDEFIRASKREVAAKTS